MGFLEELRAANIDPDKFIALQNEFIIHYRDSAQVSQEESYRESLEREQLVTMLEKFVNRLERERVQEKISAMSNPSSF